jgi:hypothetical protein
MPTHDSVFRSRVYYYLHLRHLLGVPYTETDDPPHGRPCKEAADHFTQLLGLNTEDVRAYIVRRL